MIATNNRQYHQQQLQLQLQQNGLRIESKIWHEYILYQRRRKKELDPLATGSDTVDTIALGYRIHNKFHSIHLQRKSKNINQLYPQ